VTVKFGIGKLETLSIVQCEKYFDIMNPLGVTHKCVRWGARTDEETNRRTQLANAALHYAARPKIV